MVPICVYGTVQVINAGVEGDGKLLLLGLLFDGCHVLPGAVDIHRQRLPATLLVLQDFFS